ncbi:putative reverse transcriptase domain-containing protein [Tanacetum coccineum]
MDTRNMDERSQSPLASASIYGPPYFPSVMHSDLKSVPAKETGLKPEEQKLVLRGNEMDDHKHLHVVGVKRRKGDLSLEFSNHKRGSNIQSRFEKRATKRNWLKPRGAKLVLRGQELDDHEHLHMVGVKSNAKAVLIKIFLSKNDYCENAELMEIIEENNSFSVGVRLSSSGFTAGQAALKAASGKVTKHEKACIENQHVFIPFAFDTFGFLAREAVEILSRVQRVMHSNVMTPRSTDVVFKRIGFAIQKGLAEQLVARLSSTTIQFGVRTKSKTFIEVDGWAVELFSMKNQDMTSALAMGAG